jgi:PAS domain S-box-containing protein
LPGSWQLPRREGRAMKRKPTTSDDPAELRRRAEARLRERKIVKQSDFSTQRLFHELEVHRIELEMQNAELQKTRDELEVSLEKITDLYDFAPVGYFSIDESGVILEANLKSAALLGMERSRLINRSVLLFVDQKVVRSFLAFLKNVLAEPKDQECEALLLKKGGGTFLAVFRATSAVCPVGARRWCRVAFGDVTARKQAEEAQRRLERPGQHKPGVEPGNCPAADGRANPQEKRTEPEPVAEAVAPHAGTIAALVSSDSTGAGGGTNAHQPRPA